MSAIAAKSRARALDRVAGSPRDYAELKAFLPAPKQRQIALGVTGNTIAAWDRGTASRIVKRHQESVAIVLDTLRQLSVVVGSPERAGRMFTSPLPLLQDMVPAQLVHAGGHEEAAVVMAAIRNMQRAAEQTILRRIAEDDALWDSFEASLSPASRARAQQTTTAIEEYRAKTGGVSALD